MLSTTRNPHEKRDDSPHLLAVASLALLQDTPGKLTECNKLRFLLVSLEVANCQTNYWEKFGPN